MLLFLRRTRNPSYSQFTPDDQPVHMEAFLLQTAFERSFFRILEIRFDPLMYAFMKTAVPQHRLVHFKDQIRVFVIRCVRFPYMLMQPAASNAYRHITPEGGVIPPGSQREATVAPNMGVRPFRGDPVQALDFDLSNLILYIECN